jgi:hypothetical protein
VEPERELVESQAGADAEEDGECVQPRLLRLEREGQEAA